MIVRAAEKAAKKRRLLGKSDRFDGSNVSPQVVSAFQLIDVPSRKLKVLSLQCPSGFRCDFALSTTKVDQLGRLMPQALAEELLAEKKKDTRNNLN